VENITSMDGDFHHVSMPSPQQTYTSRVKGVSNPAKCHEPVVGGDEANASIYIPNNRTLSFPIMLAIPNSTNGKVPINSSSRSNKWGSILSFFMGLNSIHPTKPYTALQQKT
jgi:hypothetical protein